MSQVERAMLAVLPVLGVGLLLSMPLLLVDVGNSPGPWFVAQLIALVAIAFVLSLRLLAYPDASWFEGIGWSVRWRLVGSGVSIVALVTGVVALVTLASSAALRFDPSIQFLQLLSALDIAWVVAAVMVGAHRAWGRGAAAITGVVMGVVCVWSIWRYLDAVGFGPGGEWIVSGSDLMQLVIPFDIVAAVVAVGLFVYGTLRIGGAIEQARPQS